MKKTITLLMCLLSGISMAQVTTTVSPASGCPNTTHDIAVSVTNNSPFSIAVGTGYTVDVTIFDALNNPLKHFSQLYMDGIGLGASKTVVIEDVPFSGPMTCTVSGTLSTDLGFGPISFDVNQTYVVQYPPTLAIADDGQGTYSVTTALEGYSVRYFLNNNLSNPVSESLDGTYFPTTPGSYTAYGYDPISTCYSDEASNALVMEGEPTAVKAKQEVNVTVYPNPIGNSITLKTDEEILYYEITKMDGVSIKSGSTSSMGIISTEELKSGSYILTVKSPSGKRSTLKLIK